MRLALKVVPIFAGLEEKALDVLLEEAKREVFPAGKIVLREGEDGHRMYLIEAGKVLILKSFGQSNEIELAQFGPGEFFGEMCILEPMPREATAQAVMDSTLIGISSSAFHHLYQRMPAQHSILLLNIARDLSRRLRRLDEVFAAKQ
jgi:CRP-like cAMP-binding protein